MQDCIGDARRRLDTHLAGGWLKQGEDLGRAGAHIFMRLARWLALRLPTAAGMRHGLERPRLVLAPPGRERCRVCTPARSGFFPAASGSRTTTAPPCLRLRTAIPVAHQVRR